MKRWSCVAILSYLLWGCSSEEVNTIAPAPLPNITEEVSVNTLWSNTVGSGLSEKFIRIKPAVMGDTIFAASADGVVAAYDRMSGAKRWEMNLETPISGGVGAGENAVLVGTLNGELVALNAQDGAVLWRAPVASEILSVPQVSDGLVVAQSNDDTVMAFNISDGSQRWSYNDTAPPLTIRGTASPILFDGVAAVGLSNGRVAVISLAQGDVLWDRTVAVGEGRTELDRLGDVDGSPATNQGLLFVGNYQGQLVSFDARTGDIKWQNDFSTLVTPVVDSSNVYATNAEGHIAAFDQEGGSPLWTVEELANRLLTAPELWEGYVVVADFDGYVHLLSTSDGHFVGRTRADGDGVRVQPLVVDDVMYVYGNGGKLVAYRLIK